MANAKNLTSWTPTTKTNTSWVHGNVVNVGTAFTVDNSSNFLVDNSGNFLVTNPTYVTDFKSPASWTPTTKTLTSWSDTAAV